MKDHHKIDFEQLLSASIETKLEICVFALKAMNITFNPCVHIPANLKQYFIAFDPTAGYGNNIYLGGKK